MPTFYLTPTAINDLTLLIFAVFNTGYLVHLVWRTWAKRPFQTIFFLLTTLFTTGYLLLDILYQTLYPDLSYWLLPWQSVFITLGMVCILQFAYRMPELYPQRESRVVLGLSLLLPLWEAGFAVHRHTRLVAGEIIYRPPYADYFWAVVFIWLWIVFVRQAGLADARPLPLWRKLWQPQGRAARAARDFCWVFLLPVGLMAVTVMRNDFFLGTTITHIILTLGMLGTLLAISLVYLNYQPEQTSFMVRLSAITLAFFLGILGAVGQAMAPPFIDSYHNHDLITAPQTLRFTPNAQGGYDIVPIPYQFDPLDENGAGLGESLTHDKNLLGVPLNFEFPFYDQHWSRLFVRWNGGVTFGKNIDLFDTLFRYGSVPAIYMLGGELEEDVQPDPLSGVYALTTPEQLTLTWLDMPENAVSQNRHTFQLRLYASGVFEMTFVERPARPLYDINNRWRTNRFIGVLPGDTAVSPHHVRFNTDLPLSSGPNGVIEDYHLGFRAELHHFLTPLFWLTLFSAALVIVGLPMTFRRNLIKPLENLLAGVRKVNDGRLDTRIPITVEDEFGYLTHSFNNMTSELGELVGNLEDRVAKRTAQLTENAAQLAENAAQLADTTAYLDNILRSATEYAITTVDRDFRITYINSLAEELYGVSAAAVLGEFVTVIPSRKIDSERFRDGLRHVETHGAHEYTRKVTTPDGTRHITSRLSGIYDKQGEMIGYAHFSQDISERLHTESQLLTQQRAIAVLEDRAQIGQELHDRLGQVFGFLSLQSQAAQALFATEQRDDGDRVLTRLAAVAQDAHGQVREFILGMRGGTAVQQNFWDTLQAYADKLHNLYQMQVILRLHGLPTEQAQLLPPDKELHLLRLIQEALTNTRRHSGVHQAQVSFRQDGAMVHVTIADDGRGFELPAFPIAHRPFAGALELAQLEQLGLVADDGHDHFGLLGMYEHAAALDGKLQIRSRLGAGTQIILTFPLDPQGEMAAAALANLPNLRVLLVDDQPIFLEGLNNLLTAHGLQVVGMAHDGLQAQELARTTRPDVIVMDIHMPVCDGITAVKNIKQEFPNIDIVMLSVSAEEETLFEALQAGASGYLLKSMQAKEFFLLLTGLADGVPPLAPQLAGKVLTAFRSRLQTDVTLTDEQARLLSLVAKGLNYFQISMELDMSERTVKRHMKKILQLLHLSSRAEAAAYARLRGL